MNLAEESVAPRRLNQKFVWRNVCSVFAAFGCLWAVRAKAVTNHCGAAPLNAGSSVHKVLHLCAVP